MLHPLEFNAIVPHCARDSLSILPTREYPLRQLNFSEWIMKYCPGMLQASLWVGSFRSENAQCTYPSVYSPSERREQGINICPDFRKRP